MKWKCPEWGATRIIKRFLFFPTRIDNEVRWLEHATIKQKFRGEWNGWVNYSWIDEV